MSREMSDHRRGAAIVAIIMVLLLMNLLIVGMVLGGARDLDMAVMRTDTVRAEYVVDAGTHMAMRELFLGSDVDSDGGIGSVSDDGNAANNPTIGGASFQVSMTVTASGADLSVNGIASTARKKTQLTLTGGESTTLLYSENPSTIPVTRTWSGSSWSLPSITLSVSAKPRWIVAAACPVRDEIAAVISDNKKDVNVMVKSGSTWGNLLEVTSNMGNGDDRPLSIAYEQISGDGLVVYRSGNDSSIYYRTWNGTSWSSQLSTANLTSGNPPAPKLVPRPATNEIFLVALDDDNDLVVMIWNGSAWSSKLLLDSNAATDTEECFDLVFETVSNDALVVWSRNGQTSPRYRTFSGSWSIEGIAANVGGESNWIRLAPNPVNDRVMMMTLDDQKDANLATWSGSGWGAATEVETNVSLDDRRAIAVAYEPAGINAVTVYSEGTNQQPRYRTFNGTSWLSEQTGPSLGDDIAALSAMPCGDGQDIFFLAVTKGNDSLRFFRWNGSAMVDQAQIEDNLAGSDKHESFAMVKRDQGTLRLASIVWTAP